MFMYWVLQYGWWLPELCLSVPLPAVGDAGTRQHVELLVSLNEHELRGVGVGVNSLFTSSVTVIRDLAEWGRPRGVGREHQWLCLVPIWRRESKLQPP